MMTCPESEVAAYWTPEGLSNQAGEWWMVILRRHPLELDEKIEGLLAKATYTEGGCRELGTADRPARIQWKGQRLRVYQLVAWSKAGRPPRKGEVVRHLCNNRACINPEHLKVGSQRQNLNDQRQRIANRAAHWAYPK